MLRVFWKTVMLVAMLMMTTMTMATAMMMTRTPRGSSADADPRIAWEGSGTTTTRLMLMKKVPPGILAWAASLLRGRGSLMM